MPPPIPRFRADRLSSEDAGRVASPDDDPSPPGGNTSHAAPSLAPPDRAQTPAPVNVRAATRDDGERLAAWLQSRRPLPAIARRAREEALFRLLDRPELGLCLLAGAGQAWSACLPVHLLPRLDLGGLAVLAAEWWSEDVPMLESERQHAHRGPLLAACRNWLADWCRAHGVRHLLLAPALAPARDDADAAKVKRLPDGLWHRDLAPAAKLLS